MLDEQLRLCFIADLNDIHAQKWIRYFCHRGQNVHVISTTWWGGSLSGAQVHNLETEPTGSGGYTRNGPNSFKLRLKASVLSCPQLCPLSLFVANAKGELRKPLNTIRWLRQVRRLVHHIRPDLLHCLRLPNEGYLGGLSGFHPLLVSSWGNDFIFFARRVPLCGLLTRHAIKQTDVFFSDCQRDVRLAQEAGFSPQQPWFVFPGDGGVELDAPAPGERHAGRAAFRRSVGVTTEERLIVCLRGFTRSHFYQTVLEGFARMTKSEPSVRLLMVGIHEGAHFAAVRELVCRFRLTDRVILHPQVPHPMVKQLIWASDLVISVTPQEGTPNSMLETMWHGGIPIYSDAEPVRDWIKDGVNGYLVKPDPEEVASVTRRALAEKPRHELFRARNRVLILKRADYAKNMAAVLEIYRKIVTENREVPRQSSRV
jgi:glycosyltransferase involved in cell wall biosynthesis